MPCHTDDIILCAVAKIGEEARKKEPELAQAASRVEAICTAFVAEHEQDFRKISASVEKRLGSGMRRSRVDLV